MKNDKAVIVASVVQNFTPEQLALGDKFRELNNTLELSKGKLLTALEQSQNYMIKCGEFLIDAKKKVETGQWYLWLNDCAKIHPRTAARYMRTVSHQTELTDLDDKKVVAGYVELDLIEPPALKKPKAKKDTPEKSDILKIKELVCKLWELLETARDKQRAKLELAVLNEWQAKVTEQTSRAAEFEAAFAEPEA